MIYVQVSLILFLLISKALCIFNFTRHFGTKGLYPITTNTTPPLESPDSCVLVQLHLVARHGARFPTGGDVKKFDILDKLFANIPLAKDWQNPFNYSKEGLLTDRGENELYLLGQRARQRYYKFWNNLTYDPNVVEFKSSAVSRTGQSGISYAFGLFSGYGSLSDMKLQPIYISSVPRNQDRELSMHYACPLWLSTVKESSNFTRKQQEEKYLNSFISTISKRISDRLKIHPPLDPIHADYIYRACSFAVSFSNEYDTWCSLLEKDDFLKLEYFSDMGDFYSYAYGYQLNTKLACQFFSSFVESVESYLNGQSQVKSTLKFAHAETIIFLTTMLGLYEDDYPLAADTSPQQIASRKFRTSRLAPFTANVYFEIYNCSTKYDVDPTFGTILIQLMVNEKPTVIPKCIYTYCPWNTFKQILGDDINCDFDDMCKLTPTKFSLLIQHYDNTIYF